MSHIPFFSPIKYDFLDTGGMIFFQGKLLKLVNTIPETIKIVQSGDILDFL